MIGIGIGIPVSCTQGGGGAGQFAPIPGLGNLKTGIYNAFTRGTLVPTYGPTFSLTRATASTTVDGPDGLVKPILSGEARFWKLRRVENKVTTGRTSKPTQLFNVTLDSVIDDPAGGSLAGRFTITNGASFQVYSTYAGSVVAGSTIVGSLSLRGVGASIGKTVALWLYENGTNVNATITLTGSYQRVQVARSSVTGGADTRIGLLNGGTIATNDKVDLAFLQIEDISGAAIQVAGEYVSVGVASSPYFGAGVDGVKYFNTANGNTVASNVVTEATGASLTLTAAGLSVFGAATNVVLWNRDLTNAAWTASNVTVAKTATGADGVANSASTLTATAGNGTVLQAITLGSSARSQECYVKRRTGSGTINMTTDNGTTWTAITVTSSWAKQRIPVQTLANPTVGFRIVTSGDAIDVDYVMNTSVVDAPAVATTTASVTVNADDVTASSIAVINATEGTVFAKALGVPDANNHYLFALGTNTNNSIYFVNRSTPLDFYEVANGGVTQASISNGGAWDTATSRKVAFRYRANDFGYAKDGSLIGADASGTIPAIASLFIGQNSANASYRNGVIQEVAYSVVGATDANLALATT